MKGKAVEVWPKRTFLNFTEVLYFPFTVRTIKPDFDANSLFFSKEIMQCFEFFKP